MRTHVGGAVAGGVVVVPVDAEDGEAHRVVGVLVVHLPEAGWFIVGGWLLGSETGGEMDNGRCVGGLLRLVGYTWGVGGGGVG